MPSDLLLSVRVPEEKGESEYLSWGASVRHLMRRPSVLRASNLARNDHVAWCQQKCLFGGLTTSCYAIVSGVSPRSFWQIKMHHMIRPSCWYAQQQAFIFVHMVLGTDHNCAVSFVFLDGFVNPKHLGKGANFKGLGLNCAAAQVMRPLLMR